MKKRNEYQLHDNYPQKYATFYYNITIKPMGNFSEFITNANKEK